MAKRIVDLTFPLHQGMPKFFAYWHPYVQIKKMGKHNSEGRQTTKIILGSHSGTHMDAPLHFIPRGRSIDKIRLELCIGPAVLVNLSGIKKREVGIKDLRRKLRGLKRIERLIVRFDWSKNWGKDRYFKKYPYFSEGACRWMVKKGIKLIGVDTPSPDDPRYNRKSGHDSPNHKYLLKNGVVMVEYLCNLNKLKGRRIFFISLPLKISGADGAPTRALAYEI